MPRFSGCRVRYAGAKREVRAPSHSGKPALPPHGRGVPVCRSEDRLTVCFAMCPLTHAPNLLG